MKRDVDQLLHDYGITTAGRISPNPEWEPEKGGKKLRKDRWMNDSEAIFFLKLWAETNIPKHNLHYPRMAKLAITSGVENAYLTVMINELIRRVIKNDCDPITTVAQYNEEMDQVIAMSDNNHVITHHVAGYLERSSYEVLLYLKEKEKELNKA